MGEVLIGKHDWHPEASLQIQYGVRMRTLLLCPGILACPSLPCLLPTRLRFPDHPFTSCSVFQSQAPTADFKAHHRTVIEPQ